MNVNGLTGSQAAVAAGSKDAQRIEKKSKPGIADQVRIGSVDRARSLQVVADRSLQKILEMTQLAAKELGYDLSTVDTSPQAVSGRIADFAIGLFGLYQQQNPDMSEEHALVSYQALINGAIDQGYSEALGILSNLGVNDKGILDTAANTIQMAHDRFNKFIETRLVDLRSGNPTAVGPAAPTSIV
ncbi:MAG: DUF5610 domain-containing protein [Deltaproteobacteria bacterium]|nr:DUF5610 domain-containing protein [Deltaproteobacteria bacterium]